MNIFQYFLYHTCNYYFEIIKNYNCILLSDFDYYSLKFLQLFQIKINIKIISNSIIFFFFIFNFSFKIILFPFLRIKMSIQP